MSPRYSQQVSRTSNLYPSACIRRHICIRIEVARPGYMYPGDIVSWCKRGITHRFIVMDVARGVLGSYDSQSENLKKFQQA